MISTIVCVDSNWGIGSNGDLLVHIPEDMKFFKEKTMTNVVVMGRKTFDSLPVKPLAGRVNCVITSKTDSIEYNYDDNYYLMSMNYVKECFIPTFSTHDYINVFVIGGGSIYKELLPYCEKAYVTKVLNSYENADTYFPNLDNIPEWEIECQSEIKEHNGVRYQFYTYRKKV